MSRFANLEFNSDSDGRQNEQRSAGRDESFYMPEAQNAFENGDFEQALRSFARVLEHNPKNVAAWAGQVRMLIELEEFSEAKLWADKALESFPREPELLAAKAVALARVGDLDAALAFSDASFEERGDSSYLWLARGDVFLARNEPSASYCFERATILAPGNIIVRWLISRVYLYYKKFAMALKVIQDAFSAGGASCVIWVQLAMCQHGLGMLDAATQSIGCAMELSPRNPAALRAQKLVQNTDWVGAWRGKLRRFFSK